MCILHAPHAAVSRHLPGHTLCRKSGLLLQISPENLTRTHDIGPRSDGLNASYTALDCVQYSLNTMRYQETRVEDTAKSTRSFAKVKINDVKQVPFHE